AVADGSCREDSGDPYRFAPGQHDFHAAFAPDLPHVHTWRPSESPAVDVLVDDHWTPQPAFLLPWQSSGTHALYGVSNQPDGTVVDVFAGEAEARVATAM